MTASRSASASGRRRCCSAASCRKGGSRKRAPASTTSTREFFDGGLAARYDAVVGGRRYVYERADQVRQRAPRTRHPPPRARLLESPLARARGRDEQPRSASRSACGARRSRSSASSSRRSSRATAPRRCCRERRSRSRTRRTASSLRRDVQNLLLEFGVVSRLCHYAKGEIKVVITNRRDARLFAARVGFWGRKQSKLDAHPHPDPGVQQRDEQRPRALRRRLHPLGVRFAVGRQGLAPAPQRRPHRALGAGRHRDPRARSLRRSEARRRAARLRRVLLRRGRIGRSGRRAAGLLAARRLEGSLVHHERVRQPQHRGPPGAACDRVARGHRQRHGRLRPELRRVAQAARVLPSRFPNLLVNGSQGIAVGMATNIPPHNLAK